MDLFTYDSKATMTSDELATTITATVTFNTGSTLTASGKCSGHLNSLQVDVIADKMLAGLFDAIHGQALANNQTRFSYQQGRKGGVLTIEYIIPVAPSSIMDAMHPDYGVRRGPTNTTVKIAFETTQGPTLGITAAHVALRKACVAACEALPHQDTDPQSVHVERATLLYFQPAAKRVENPAI